MHKRDRGRRSRKLATSTLLFHNAPDSSCSRQSLALLCCKTSERISATSRLLVVKGAKEELEDHALLRQALLALVTPPVPLAAVTAVLGVNDFRAERLAELPSWDDYLLYMSQDRSYLTDFEMKLGAMVLGMDLAIHGFANREQLGTALRLRTQAIAAQQLQFAYSATGPVMVAGLEAHYFPFAPYRVGDQHLYFSQPGTNQQRTSTHYLQAPAQLVPEGAVKLWQAYTLRRRGGSSSAGDVPVASVVQHQSSSLAGHWMSLRAEGLGVATQLQPTSSRKVSGALPALLSEVQTEAGAVEWRAKYGSFAHCPCSGSGRWLPAEGLLEAITQSFVRIGIEDVAAATSGSRGQQQQEQDHDDPAVEYYLGTRLKKVLGALWREKEQGENGDWAELRANFPALYALCDVFALSYKSANNPSSAAGTQLLSVSEGSCRDVVAPILADGQRQFLEHVLFAAKFFPLFAATPGGAFLLTQAMDRVSLAVSTCSVTCCPSGGEGSGAASSCAAGATTPSANSIGVVFLEVISPAVKRHAEALARSLSGATVLTAYTHYSDGPKTIKATCLGR
eukprot:g14170.t1